MSITAEQLNRLDLANSKVIGNEGHKIGDVGQIYVDDTTGEPSWVTVKTGLFGSSESFVPLQQADLNGPDIIVGLDKATVKDAPRVDPDGSLSRQEEDELYRYYGLSAPTEPDHSQARTDDPAGAGPDPEFRPDDRHPDHGPGDGDRRGDDNEERHAPVAERPGADQPRYGSPEQGQDPVSSGRAADHEREREQGHPGAVGRDTSGPTTDQAMTRSEEELHLGTQSRESGRARLRKYVVTENVTQTVPVSHEEVRLEREPITDANRADAGSGPDISEEEHEVTLHEEVPVVQKETVAKERVRLGSETVADEATVSEDVRKEQIEMADHHPGEDDVDTRPTPPQR